MREGWPAGEQRASDAVIAQRTAVAVRQEFDPQSRAWLDLLRSQGRRRDAGVERLHQLLLRMARFAVSKRAPPHLRGDEAEDIALQATDNALVRILACLDDYRGASRFTTWAYKFALLEAAVELRKRAWQARELPLAAAVWAEIPTVSGAPDEQAENAELLAALRRALDEVLTPYQRAVFVAAALNSVPIDVLADRFATSRGAVYKSLHDARRKLRAHLSENGLAPDGWTDAPPREPPSRNEDDEHAGGAKL
jgi:RNA polymerase sigma-70 factor (ECF subfamily)